MNTLKFQTKFCGILITLYQGDLVEEPVEVIVAANDSDPLRNERSLFASTALNTLNHAAEQGCSLVAFPLDFPEERHTDILLDIVMICTARKTSVQEVRITLSEDSAVEVFLREFESRRFEPWPQPFSYAAEKAQHLARLKAKGYLEA